jgi:predicted exporter
MLTGDWESTIRRRIEPSAIASRVALIRATALSPGGGFDTSLLTHDPLGFFDDLGDVSPTAAPLPIDPLSMGFMAPNGEAALVIITPRRSEIDPGAGRILMAELDAAYARVQREIDVPLHFAAVGGPLYAAQDETILRQDLSLTVTTSAIGCTVILIAAFGGLAIPLTIAGTVLIALAWTAGLLGLTLGSVTAAGVGFAAVLIGLGMDYGIHGATRYRQALATQTQDRSAALAITFREAGAAILSSATTTAVAFAVLWMASFRPLRELGAVVAIGITCVLVASATVGACALARLRLPARAPEGLLWRASGRLVDTIVRQSSERPWAVIIIAAAVSLVTGAGALRLGINPDLRSFRPEDHPAVAAEQSLTEIFGLGLDTTTIVVPGATLDQSLDRSSAIEALIESEIGESADISSPSTWMMPSGAILSRLERLQRLDLRRAADELERALRLAGLNPASFAPGLNALRAFDEGRDPSPPDFDAAPAWLADLIRQDRDGAWTAIRVRTMAGTWSGGPPAELVAKIHDAVPGCAVASVPAIGASIRGLARRDIERLAGLAFVALCLIVVLSFRGNLAAAALAGLPVLLGTLWTLGAWGLAGKSLDLFSLAVLPIMLGIGIDDGLHAAHGQRDHGGIAGSVRVSGRAMILTSVTTSVGFGSLVLSRIPGLRMGGLLVALGVLACLAATLFVLPAVASLRRP